MIIIGLQILRNIDRKRSIVLDSAFYLIAYFKADDMLLSFCSNVIVGSFMFPSDTTGRNVSDRALTYLTTKEEQK
jgi:hypothetical protein